MNQQQRLALLTTAIARYREFDELESGLIKLFGAQPDSQIMRQFAANLDALFHATQAAIGDNNDRLFWYVYDTNCGVCCNTVMIDQEVLAIITLEELIFLIDTENNISSVD